MGFKEKMQKRSTDMYLKRYGDRLAQVQGNAISVKIEEKTILWIFYKLKVIILVKPERSRSISKCVYKKNKWFKKPTFIPVSQGNFLQVTGLKGKKGKEDRETIEIINVRNLSSKKDLHPVEGKPQKVQRVKRMK